MSWAWLDEEPVVVAIAGPNGAGKTTFYHAHIAPAGLRLVNADRLAAELDIDPYAAAQVADQVRHALVNQQESFAFETVFSDPVHEKLQFLESCAASGYTTALMFIGLASPKLSAERVAMRVSQGGHDVPADKITNRFPRTLANLQASIKRLPHVVIYDNSDLANPYRQLAVFTDSEAIEMAKPIPKWLRNVLEAV
ncbi:zeta toxin family protein [Bythopirellula goksoeyrii]|uniref:Zeta toxin n=1 Tax=Bythopirellula goksoeyrii TaxID=1400387 RepID=A0A5B9QEQ5_9BACT|nr:zeta toxin family protein [Bythopirellula goksoeyrii]QEG37434.1 Zeta toxin [Bythopirellula goksoeyrii]